MTQAMETFAPATIKEPILSVVMSVRNAERFLRESIDSVLKQTLSEFEFIVIDDGSTDSTREIVESIKDSRIILRSRENKGLPASLNEGMGLARGKYVARMDGDDLARADRFAKQVAYLEEHPECLVVASVIDRIREDGSPLPPWYEERLATTPQDIFERMPVGCCIAHPSVMFRRDSVPPDGYKDVPLAEDWDLWLRFLRRGPVIHKLNEPLLQYRIHDASLMGSSQEGGTSRERRFHRHYLYRSLREGTMDHAARYYLIECIKALGRWPIQCARRAARWALGVVIERRVEHLRKRADAQAVAGADIAILAPWLTVGGAERVVIDLANGLSHSRRVSFLVTHRAEHTWREKLNPEVRFYDVGRLRMRPMKEYGIVRHLLENKVGTLFISNSDLAYASLPLIKSVLPEISVIDILHSQGGLADRGSAPQFSDPYRELMTHRVVVSAYLKEYMCLLYRERPERMTVIHNGIDVKGASRSVAEKANGSRIVWVGRLSDEKKPLLALHAFAKLVSGKKKQLELQFIGDGDLRPVLEEQIERLGLHESVSIEGYRPRGFDFISEACCLLLTSEMEGLPIVVIEAIHAGTPVVASNVGGLAELVRDGENGYLVEYSEGNAKGFATALDKVLGWDDGQRAACAKYDRDLTESLTTEAMVKEYVGLIERLGR